MVMPDSCTTTSIHLTPRELEVLTWAARGKTYAEIAMVLIIAPDTAKTHIKNASRKLNTMNKAHAIAVAITNKLIAL